MLGNGGSNRAFPFLGIAEGHHQISHHQGAAENHRKLEIIDIWEMEQLARFLGPVIERVVDLPKPFAPILRRFLPVSVRRERLVILGE